MAKYFPIALLFCFLVSVRTSPQGRIVRGKPAFEGQFPYQVSLRDNGEHVCGGSIISNKFILTAAHCVGEHDENENFTVDYSSNYTICAGTTSRSKCGVKIPVEKIIVHEGFKKPGSHDDIAIVKLGRPLNFSETVQPISLPSSDTPANKSITISGWGRLGHKGKKPKILQWTVLKSTSKDECYGDNLLCLAHEKNEGVCNGDSGGPATNDKQLVGISSFIAEKCGSELPDAYVRVFYYLDWIKEVL